MAAFFTLIGLAIFLIFPLWVFIRLREQRETLRGLQTRLAQLEADARARAILPAPPQVMPSLPHAAIPAAVEPPPVSQSVVEPPLPVPAFAATAVIANDLAATPPPPLPITSAPPPPPVPPPIYATPAPTLTPKRSMNWEQFMGVKLFAWLGGLALFLSAVFFIKLSIEEGWVSPEVRVSIGFALGAGLLVGGKILWGKRFAVTAQTFCATGIVTLYAMTFASHTYYGFFGTGLTFGLMIVITALAFALALRLQARVVAVLGLLGGFLTPVLISTGQENALGLFSYIAFLDTGLLAVALASGWSFLIPLAAAGTIVMEAAWNFRFLRADTATTVAFVAGFFDFLFLLGATAARRWKKLTAAYSLPVAVLVLFSFILAWDLGLDLAPALTTGQWLGFVFFADLCILGVIALGEDVFQFNLTSGLVVFLLLGAWTTERLSPSLLPWAFGAYLLYAALHGIYPLLLQRWYPERKRLRGAQIFPVLSLVLLVAPNFVRVDGSILVWPVILVLDGLIIAMAARSRATLTIIFALLLTFVIAGNALEHLPVTETPVAIFLLIGGFSIFFFAAGLWRRASEAADAAKTNQSSISLWATLFPFTLLVLASQRVAMPNPHLLFSVSLLLSAMAFAAAYFLGATATPIFALLGVALVGETWQLHNFYHLDISTPIAWYTVFYLLFTAYPFLAYNRFIEKRGPWIASALAGPAFFWLTYSLIARAWPYDKIGWLPALFALAPALAAWRVTQVEKTFTGYRLNRIALYAGASACFVALIFPIQFERQWMTSGWALEGVAILWLFKTWPHRGLAGLGVLLLFAAFFKLAVAPAVFEHPLHQTTPIFNVYLWTYGLATICLIVGARLAWRPTLKLAQLNVPIFLNILGGVLLFLLINIEIADYYTRGRGDLVFEFSGNFGRDMAYTVAWATYALALLVLGIWRQVRGCRYAAVALLAATLVKLFFFDLAQLDRLYRIGALVGVAIVAILASVLYQRFVPDTEKTEPPPDELT